MFFQLLFLVLDDYTHFSNEHHILLFQLSSFSSPFQNFLKCILLLIYEFRLHVEPWPIPYILPRVTGFVLSAAQRQWCAAGRR